MSGQPYADQNIERIRQEAVAKMREMQEGARRDDGFPGGGAGPRNRNWSTNPNVQRRNRAARRQAEESAPPEPPARERHPPAGGGKENPDRQYIPEQPSQAHHNRSQEAPGPPPTPPPVPQPQPPAPKETTVLQDILSAVGLDDDRILILGLILILINDKADTTLILALCYLLI